MTTSTQASLSDKPNMQAFLSLGFRPLYIAGCLWALVSIAIWIFAPQIIPAPFDGLSWHAHEMLWAFIATIAVGFLLTASANWTKINPLKGKGLAAISILWAISRAAFLIGGNAVFWLGVIAESLFFLISAICLLRVVTKSGSQRNYGLPILVLALGMFNLLYLQAVVAADYTRIIEQFNFGMLCMALIALLIARRVIPFFAMRRVPNLQIPMQTRSGQVQLVLTIIAIGFGVLKMPAVMSLALALTGVISLWQTIHWKPRAVLHNPMLWILYLGYVLMGLGLIVAALQISGISTGIFSRAAVHVHIIGMGGFAILIIGMVTRTALGHLGRPLALDASMLVSYYFMIAAVILRLAALWPSAWYQAFLDAAALSWIVCMGLYLWRFIPMLIRPRY